MSDKGQKSSFPGLDCIILTNCDVPFASHGFGSGRPQVVFGKVVLRARKPTEIQAVACRLQGRAKSILTSKYADKVAIRGSSYYFYIGPLSTLNSKQETLNGNEPPPKYTITTGGIEFPFQVTVDPSVTLPAAFQNPLGSVKYELAVHARSEENADFLLVSKTTVQLCPQRAKIPRSLPDYFIVTRRGGHPNGNHVEAELRLFSDTFLRGEQIKFKLKVKNRNGGRIWGMKVALMKKTAFYAERFSKSEFAEVCSKEIKDTEISWTQENDSQTYLWERAVAVPPTVPPSFATKEKCVEVFYFVQFIVTIVGKGLLQGEKQVIIATHPTENARPVHGHTHMRPSLSGANTHFDAPPPYSSFRNMRKPSIETLPPSYEELVPEPKSTREEWV